MSANAGRLPLSEASLDHVYSFGVNHHTAEPAAIVQEVKRVPKPGGTVTVMLDDCSSLNHRVEILVLRKLGRLLLDPNWAPALLARLLRVPREKLERHRRQRQRVPHATREQWVSMNTDGPDCPLARVYSARRAGWNRMVYATKPRR